MTELINRFGTPVGLNSLPTGTLIEVDKLPQMEIIRLQGELNRANYQINRLEQHIDILDKKIKQIEKVKIARFNDNDVYEVNKRIERLDAEVALINFNLTSNPVMKFCLRFFNG